jgi:hypothetical protein
MSHLSKLHNELLDVLASVFFAPFPLPPPAVTDIICRLPPLRLSDRVFFIFTNPPAYISHPSSLFLFLSTPSNTYFTNLYVLKRLSHATCITGRSTAQESHKRMETPWSNELKGGGLQKTGPISILTRFTENYERGARKNTPEILEYGIRM